MNQDKKPVGFHTITPNSIVKNFTQSVEFYTKVFGSRAGRVIGSFGNI